METKKLWAKLKTRVRSLTGKDDIGLGANGDGLRSPLDDYGSGVSDADFQEDDQINRLAVSTSPEEPAKREESFQDEIRRLIEESLQDILDRLAEIIIHSEESTGQLVRAASSASAAMPSRIAAAMSEATLKCTSEESERLLAELSEEVQRHGELIATMSAETIATREITNRTASASEKLLQVFDSATNNTSDTAVATLELVTQMTVMTKAIKATAGESKKSRIMLLIAIVTSAAAIIAAILTR